MAHAASEIVGGSEGLTNAPTLVETLDACSQCRIPFLIPDNERFYAGPMSQTSL
jgi:hypothetical protein